MPPTSRNASCTCHSGLRYKHCCGRQLAFNDPRPSCREDLRLSGLEFQKRGHFVEAINRYDAVLLEAPNDWDVAHMRALALYQLGAIEESMSSFARLLSTPAEKLPGFWTNLGLLIAACSPDPLADNGQQKPAMPSHRYAQKPCSARTLPSISVVMPTYNHARFVKQAIRSVFAQSCPPLEFIVIDDGSTDETAKICETEFSAAPFPVTFLSRENRGAPATLNQAVEMAKGDFIQLLNSDDLLSFDRIEVMLSALSEHDGDWGFARAQFLNDRGEHLDTRDPRAGSLTRAQDSIAMSGTRGMALLRANAAISSGNLTFRKTLWHAVGGMRDYRYNHDWDFCLRASLISEPIIVPRPLYHYRIHAHNTINEDRSAPQLEYRRMMAEFIRDSNTRTDWPNPAAPTLANWRNDYLALLGAMDALQHAPRTLIQEALKTVPERMSAS